MIGLSDLKVRLQYRWRVRQRLMVLQIRRLLAAAQALTEEKNDNDLEERLTFFSQELERTRITNRPRFVETFPRVLEPRERNAVELGAVLTE